MIALLQAAGESSMADTFRMLQQNSSPTGIIVVAILSLFSLVSWVLIAWKWKQFRTLRKDGFRFVQAIERSQRLDDAYRTAQRLPETPYTRLFRQGANFFNELRPNALRERAQQRAAARQRAASRRKVGPRS